MYICTHIHILTQAHPPTGERETERETETGSERQRERDTYMHTHKIIVVNKTRQYNIQISDKIIFVSDNVLQPVLQSSWGGPIELFLVAASAPQRLWYVLSCLWDGAYKRTLAVNR